MQGVQQRSRGTRVTETGRLHNLFGRICEWVIGWHEGAGGSEGEEGANHDEGARAVSARRVVNKRRKTVR